MLTKIKKDTQHVYDQKNISVERIFADSEDTADNVVFTCDAIQRKTSQTYQAGIIISH